MSQEKRGFSLVELAVVITVIGLLLAGIASGSKLLEQSQIRSFIAQIDQFKSDYSAFKIEYNAVPGDMKDASAFFAGCASGGVGNANCNGNGDNFISLCMGNAWDGDQLGDEQVKFFRHLYMAGINQSAGSTILSGYNCYDQVGDTPMFPKATYKGVALSIGTVDAGNTGGSAIAAGGLVSDAGTPGSPVISSFPVLTTVLYAIKADDSGSVLNGGLTPNIAHQIDRKIDDGDAVGAAATGAATGRIRTNNDKTGSNACVTSGNYNISVVQSTCILQSSVK